MPLVLGKSQGELAFFRVEEPSLQRIALRGISARIGHRSAEDEAEKVIGGLLKDRIRLGLGEGQVAAHLRYATEVVAAIKVERT
jgi:hypothetical protein